MKLFESMIDTYELTNKINNYQIRKSILNAFSLKDIVKIDEKFIRDSFIRVKNLSKKVTEFTNGESLNKFSYLNLLHCPTCKDYIKIESIDTKI